ncbi:hypothetical protein Nmel_013985 [Mimus melanotis]
MSNHTQKLHNILFLTLPLLVPLPLRSLLLSSSPPPIGCSSLTLLPVLLLLLLSWLVHVWWGWSCKGANASSTGQPKILPANTASPKCQLSLESLYPSSHCSHVSLRVGKGCWWWERRVSTAPMGCVPIFGGGFCEEKALWVMSLQPASPWVVLVSALCLFACSSGCHMPVHGPLAGFEVGLCHVSAPFQPLFCSLHLLGLTLSPLRLCWGRFWHDQHCLVRSRAKL